MIPRMHLFELEDQAWFPASWRRYITDYLDHAARAQRLYEPVVPLLAAHMEQVEQRAIIDLCSGSGGPSTWVAERLPWPTTLTLTDLYPGEGLRERADGERVRAQLTPVDATAVPEELVGVRTIFAGFHHLTREQAVAALRDAANSGQAVAIFEPVPRRVVVLAMAWLIPLLVWVMTPMIRPLSVGRLVWTYLLPAVPMVAMWDGVVSALRTWTQAELLELGREAASDWSWEAGEARGPGKPLGVLYLLGRPAR